MGKRYTGKPGPGTLQGPQRDLIKAGKPGPQRDPTKTGKPRPGTLQKPENRVQGPQWDPSRALQKNRTETRDSRETGNRDPQKTGTLKNSKTGSRTLKKPPEKWESAPYRNTNFSSWSLLSCFLDLSLLRLEHVQYVSW